MTAPDGRLLFTTGRLWVNKGDQIVLLGPNGSGKTRLMAIVHQAIAVGYPGITIAPTAVEGWSDQSLGQLDAFPPPWAAVTEPFDVGDQRA